MPRWSAAEWKKWKSDQKTAWTPQKVKKQVEKEELHKNALEDQVELIRASCDAATSHRIPRPTSKQTSAAADLRPRFDAQDGIDKRKRAAEKIKHALAYRRTVLDPSIAALVDAEIAEARLVTRGGQPVSEQAVEEAIQELASRKLKLERAQNHAVVAQEHVAIATNDVQLAERDLQSLLASSSPPSSSAEKTLDAFQEMAGALSVLQNTAVATNQGTVQVDPAILNKLADMLQKGQRR